MTNTGIGAGPASAVAAVTDALARIAARNPSLNAFVAVLADEALEQAKILDEERARGHVRGPLHGVPISIKDLIDVKGIPTTAASLVRAGAIAKSDAPIVTRLRHAGAVIIGKCNLHEFALGTTNEESAFGPARNPFDLSRSPGGSSGGSAAAVSACMGTASIGTDTGGSIRIPSAACGVVGLKPASGEITTVGVVPLSPSLDHVGPIARTVFDAGTLYDVLRGAPVSAQRPATLGGLRLGKLGGYFLDRVDDQVRSRFEEALSRLHGMGVAIEDVAIDRPAGIATTYVNIALPEAYAYHARTLAQMPAAYSDGVRARLEMGREISADEYVRAQRDRATLRRSVDAILQKCDAIVLPTLPMPAPPLGADTVTIGGFVEPLRPAMLRLTQLFNLTGHPAISLPCGDTAEGLPCGFQLAGKHQKTRELLAIALACESFITPHPPRCAGDS
jgi:aspartyl-tRNA(Asn)/glutamyl-tRNA(Gln) amidotransferase subunit A